MSDLLRIKNQATQEGLWDLRYFRNQYPFSAKRRLAEFELDLASIAIESFYKQALSKKISGDCSLADSIIEYVEKDYPEMAAAWGKEHDNSAFTKIMKDITNIEKRELPPIPTGPLRQQGQP